MQAQFLDPLAAALDPLQQPLGDQPDGMPLNALQAWQLQWRQQQQHQLRHLQPFLADPLPVARAAQQLQPFVPPPPGAIQA